MNLNKPILFISITYYDLLEGMRGVLDKVENHCNAKLKFSQ